MYVRYITEWSSFGVSYRLSAIPVRAVLVGVGAGNRGMISPVGNLPLLQQDVVLV